MAHAIRLDSTSAHGTETKNGKATMSAEALKAHIDRTGNYANQENIDPTKTKDNYSLDEWDEDTSYYDRAERLRETAGINKKRDFRKGVSFCASFVVTASQEEMATLTSEQQRKYFETAKEWLDNYFGSDMLLYADVHMDESTPHLHIGYVPINEDTRNLRWDSKIKRGSMSQHFQQELPQALTDAGFDFAMPKDKDLTEAEHVSPKAYRKIEDKYKGEIKDELTKELEADYIPKYRVKRQTEVTRVIAQENRSKVDEIRQNESKVQKLNEDILRLARAKRDAEDAKTLAESEKEKSDKEAKEASESAEKASQTLTERLKDISDVDELTKAKNTLQEVLEDAGIEWKVAEELASGKTFKEAGTGKPLTASKVLRHKIRKMSREQHSEFENRQSQQIQEMDKQSSRDNDLEP